MTTRYARPTCKCGRGKRSAWDGKCGHCRTRAEAKREALYGACLKSRPTTQGEGEE